MNTTYTTYITEATEESVMNKVKVKVVDTWDWCGIPQTEIEFEDGTRESFNTSEFNDRITAGFFVEVQDWED